MAAYKSVGYGSRGADVSALQQKLNEKGYGLEVDGIFGDLTRGAVVDYQKKNALQVDGIVGEETWGHLLQSAVPSRPTASTQVLSGVSDETANRLSQLEQGYTPSDEVNAARAEQESLAALQPKEYVSGFDAQLSALYDELSARPGFSYDPAQDAAYRSYAALYERQGKAAMADTLGKASALTGGYGSTYAQSAAQQAYGQYLQALNEVIPQLQQQAYGRYIDSADTLAQRYALVQEAQQAEYEQWQAAQEAWERAVERAEDKTAALEKQDKSAYETMLKYYADKAEAEQKVSGGAKNNTGAALPSEKQQSLSSAAAESLQRAITNYCKGGDAVSAAALYQQYAGRMTPAQKKKFDALLGRYGVSV